MKALLILERRFELRLPLISSVYGDSPVVVFSRFPPFRSVFPASAPFPRGALKKYMAFIQFLRSKFRPARPRILYIPLPQMCIGSYNFRIPASRLPSLAHKTTNCVPSRFYISDVSFIFRGPDISYLPYSPILENHAAPFIADERDRFCRGISSFVDNSNIFHQLLILINFFK